MKFFELAQYFEKLEGTASRNEMTELLAELLKQVTAEEAKVVCNLALGRLAPLYERVEFNLAEKMVMKALGVAYDVDTAEVLRQYKERGDLGEVAQELASDQEEGDKGLKLWKQEKKDGKLAVEQVYEKLKEIAKSSGVGSQEKKIVKLVELILMLDELSVKYVVRIIVGKLRLGFSDKTILDALSVMEEGNKSKRELLDEVYQIFPDVGELAKLTLQHGLVEVDKRVRVTLGVPVLPALAQRLRSAAEMIKKMGKVIVEPKYDGTRVQIHYTSKASEGWKVKTFTRNLDETTHMFPELESVGEQVKAKEVILDCEAIGYDPKTGKLLPFQMTITRKRKHGIDEVAAEIPLRFFVYDILYKDGEPLVNWPLYKRREMLEEIILTGEVLEVAPAIETEDPDILREFHLGQLEEGMEGVLVKKWDAPYRSGRRGWTWVKFKEVEEAEGKLADTIDAVVMGYFRGRGKRAEFGMGAFLVGLVDSNDSEEEIVSIAKIGTGLSDKQWEEMKERVKAMEVKTKPKEYREINKLIRPDVWIRPELVVEVAADEITKSPTHSAGLALRFPRLVKFRDDKDLKGVTTVGELKQIAG